MLSTVLAGALVASLTTTVAPAADAAPSKRPAVPVEKLIPHTNTALTSLRAPTAPQAGVLEGTSWPAAGDADLSVGAAAVPNAKADTVQHAGTLPIRISPQTAAKAQATAVAAPPTYHVHLADHAAASKAGVSGVLFAVTSDGVDQPVTVGVDYSSFRNAVGADFGSRLHLVQLPACALTTPDKSECRTQTPLPAATNDATNHVVSAAVTPPARQASAARASATSMVLAATSGAAGSNGTYAASSLAPSGSWSVGGSTGNFTWTYPIPTPPPAAGKGVAPQVALTYDSSSVDGRTSSTNNQPSWIGEGWEYTPGFVERTYRTCRDDPAGTAPKTDDFCWAGQIVTMTLGGQQVSLVQDDTTHTWHASRDSGNRVELLTGTANGANNGEYWKITTPDGTQYFFGRGSGPGHTTQAGTNSTWTEPVYGAHSGEPCNNPSGFAASSCNQAWRWNLDYVEDPHGNATMYYYTTESNYYGGNNATTGVSYTRAGYLSRIDYGLRQENGTVYGATAPDQVLFTVSERCLPSGAITCDPSQFTKDNAQSWPDTPQDLQCTQGASCEIHQPTLWSTKRLTNITTQYYNGTSYTKVDSYDLKHQFFTAADPALWLSSITRTGYAADGTSVALPPVSFTGQMRDNRVLNYNNQPAMARWRLTNIATETGEALSVSYSDPECTKTNVPSDPSTDTMRCFPVRWTPPYATDPILDYFHKYLVTEVKVQDSNALTPTQRTTYTYIGTPAWHRDDNEITKPADRTYGQFRGYQQVEVRTGDPAHTTDGAADHQTLTRTTYYRGMDGDTLPDGKARPPATVPDSLGETVPDSNDYSGSVREVQSFNGDGSPQLSDTITDLSTVATSASRARTDLPALRALVIGDKRTRQFTALAAGGSRGKTMASVYDSAGRLTKQTASGDGLPDLCTTTRYADNTSTWIRNLVKEIIISREACTDADPTPTLIQSDTRTYFDKQTDLGVVSGPGDATRTESAKTNDNGALTFITTGTSEFDPSGRTKSTIDPLGHTTKTDYTPADGGVVTKTVLTNAKGQTTTTLINPDRGTTAGTIDVAGHRTDTTYDPLGRLTSVWLPGHSKANNQKASITYDYLLRADGPLAVTTKTLVDNGKDLSYVTQVQLSDSLGRPLQTQKDAEGGGRVVSDSFYDSHGWVTRTNNHYYTDGAPATTLIAVADKSVPDRTLTTYDGSGRATLATAYNGLTATWATQTIYGGDRTTVIPPQGGVPTTTITDARGKTTELRQYTQKPAITGNVVTGDAYQATTYHYTPLGQQDKITDSSGNTWTYSFDLLGRKLSQTDPDSGTTTSSYNDADQLTATTDSRNQTLAFTYDEIGRKTAEFSGSLSGTKLASWTYDTKQAGKLTYSTRYTPNGNYSVGVTGYDDMGNPGGTFTALPASETGFATIYTSSNAWTTTGLQIGVQPADGGGLPGEYIGMTYDSMGNPSTTTGVNAYVTGTSYTPYSEPNQYTVGSSDQPSWLTYGRDEQTRRLSQTTFTTQRAVAQLDDTRYSYDPAGNLTRVVDVQGPAGASTPTQTQCFGYDALARLNQAWTATDNCAAQPSASTIGGATPYWLSWTFDPSGLRKTQTQHALPGATGGDTVTTYTYPAAGAPQAHTLTGTSTTGPNGKSTTGYTYDSVGNTKTRTLPAGSQTLSWDVENRPASVQTPAGTTTYVYDADGNELLRRDPTTTTLFLPGEELARTNSTGVITGTRYYSHAGTVVALRVGGKDPVYLDGDQHGTEQVTYEPYTQTITRRAFDPYGNALGAGSGTWPDNHGFLNKPLDTATGLTDVGAREYDTATGRFISVDPVLDAASPQSLAGYTYSNNNPTTLSDPSGKHYEEQAGDGHYYYIYPGTRAESEEIAAYDNHAAEWRAQQGQPVIVDRGNGIIGVRDPKSGKSYYGGFDLGADAPEIHLLTSYGRRLYDEAGETASTWYNLDPDNNPAYTFTVKSMLESICAEYSGVCSDAFVDYLANKKMHDPNFPAGNDGMGVSGFALGAAAVGAVGASGRIPGGAPGSRPSKSFTPAGKRIVWEKNEEANDGTPACALCGTPVVKPQQSKRGVTPPLNEGAVDHRIPKVQGGSGDPSNGDLLCAVCNSVDKRGYSYWELYEQMGTFPNGGLPW
ncbi:RHS repeat-associated core domain-containing protein [Kutzneria albida]|uniref:RHS repeat-associated core domain-containing protein n=1 Tax=Kutzneria albida TaxID=43357 RepID=UPI00228766C4|nr:RHS repeat-associated core domain-containing protein [Kutzneria albida]